MPYTTGKVKCVDVSASLGWFAGVVPTQSANIEYFSIAQPNDILSTVDRIMHNNWVSLLRQAIANNIDVRVEHNAFSGQILGVQLGSG